MDGWRGDYYYQYKFPRFGTNESHLGREGMIERLIEVMVMVGYGALKQVKVVVVAITVIMS
jgi:hypothetical protein